MTTSPILLPAWVTWLSLVAWVVPALCAVGVLASAGFVLAARRAGDAERAERWKDHLAISLVIVMVFLAAQTLVVFHWPVT